MMLEGKANFEPVVVGEYIYYRRGTGGLYVYRVWKYEFRIPRERKLHKTLVAQAKQRTLDDFI